jgi:superfamily II DNA or RNA helicase
MEQLSLIQREHAKDLRVPPLEAVIPHRLGQIWHQLRPEFTAQVVEVTEVSISPRIKEPLYRLESGERLVITSRPKIARPEGADGVLQHQGGGRYRWLSHCITDAYLRDVEIRGLPTVASSIAESWTGKFHFKAERPEADRATRPGRAGLRPPQLGALHAIGAHWSLSDQPATVVMPTGTGKTETMLAMLAAYGRAPLLVVVPWDLLRGQTARKFISFGLLRKLGVLDTDAPNPIVGVITKRPDRLEDLDIFASCNVVVATASSVAMGSAIPLASEIASRCVALVVDEAHHVVAPSWSGFREAFKPKPVIQFTATPFRRDTRVLDGHVIYNYPLRSAQRDGYFKRISFEPVYEIDQRRADEAVADTAIARLREDLAAGRNHLMMARCDDIPRATAVFEFYRQKAADLKPLLIHSEMTDADERVRQLRAGESRIAVCVNMLGEGFDLPELKVAAVHDMHRSLAILLQFTGRFTRTAGTNIGDATVVANIADPDVSGALERLYSEDADWNELLSEMSSAAAKEHAELVAFLNGSRRLDGENDDEISISHHLLRPPLSTLTYRATEFRPERFHAAFSDADMIRAVWLNDTTNTLFFVTRVEPKLRWTRAKDMKDRAWGLFVVHYDEAAKLLYLSSTDHSSMFKNLAEAVGGDVELVAGDQIFRVLGHINRLIFQSVGVKKHGRRNLSYANYTGADVATALGLAEKAGSVKNNLSGTGWEDGKRVAVGCSYKGRVWSREMGSIPQFVTWCGKVGTKLLDDTIETKDIIDNVLIPTEVDALPDKEILTVEWPVELLGQSEERVVLRFGEEGEEQPLFLFELAIVGIDRATNTIEFAVRTGEDATTAQATFKFALGVPGGFKVEQASGNAAFIKAGVKKDRLDAYFSDFPPLFRFIDLCELDANMLIHPQNPQTLSIPDNRFETWDWSKVDPKIESIWKAGVERKNSIQWAAAQHYIDGGFEVVFDDDSAGEAADLVCLKEEANQIRLALVHCKFSGGKDAGERVKDVVEVCSQAVRSAKWKWRFKDLVRHLLGREDRLTGGARTTRFLAGKAADLNRFIKLSRFKEVKAEILIVQPGLSEGGRTPDQNMVLASAYTYLKETIGADLEVICSR